MNSFSSELTLSTPTVAHDLKCLQELDEVDMAILQERNRELSQIEIDTMAISEIMTQLSAMVCEQGDKLAAAEEQVTDATENTAEGVVHLSRALSFAEKSRALIVDASTLIAGTGLGALGFLASPVVGVPTLVAGLVTATSVIVIRRQWSK
uniref:t-SNARE coiled-coil homology domain-containing protein n=1 Tax=viral metagenome TaxID=1070528 RepID=A0A6C0BM89_9ZZZZ